MNLPNLNYKKTAIICCCMFFGGGFIFAYVIFPPILKFILRSVSVNRINVLCEKVKYFANFSKLF